MTGCDRIFQQQHRNKNWRDHGRQHAATYYHKRCSWRTYFHLLGIFGTVTRTARRSARKRTAVHAMVRILLEHPKAQYSSMLLRPWPVCLISRIQGHEITFTISRTLFPSSRAQTLVREETVHKSPCHAKSIQIHLNPVFMPVSSWYIPKKLRSNGLSLSLHRPLREFFTRICKDQVNQDQIPAPEYDDFSVCQDFLSLGNMELEWIEYLRNSLILEYSQIKWRARPRILSSRKCDRETGKQKHIFWWPWAQSSSVTGKKHYK